MKADQWWWQRQTGNEGCLAMIVVTEDGCCLAENRRKILFGQPGAFDMVKGFCLADKGWRKTRFSLGMGISK